MGSGHRKLDLDVATEPDAGGALASRTGVAKVHLQGPRVSPWYLNTNRIAVLTGETIPSGAQTSLFRNSHERVEAMRYAAALAEGALAAGAVPNLSEVLLKGADAQPAILASVWAKFSLRGVRRAFDRERRGLRYEPGTISTTLSVGERTLTLHGALFNEHFFSDSATHALSGSRGLYVAGQFTFEGDEVAMYPYLVADLITHQEWLPTLWRSQARVYPAAIDAFSRMARVRSPSAAELAVVRTIPERVVKQVIAELVGEPSVPKDWGGERSDLTTNQLTVGGDPMSAAFIFKGPAVRGELHPANLGKRGDQLVRAFEEPVDLVVVQHCDRIASSVVSLAEALATNLARPRRYCILDGADTYRILKVYGMLPAQAGTQ